MVGEVDDVTLPKATVQKIISEVLDSDLTFSKEAREIIIECGVEFIMMLAGSASEIADKELKKTIAPDHVIKSLQDLEFDEFIPPLEEILHQHKENQKIRERRDAKFKKSGLSEEELLRQQEELFRQSRSRLQQTSSVSDVSGNEPETALKTEEF
ncbi:Negative cofactor 2 complex subunit beta [Kluyveromyces marxianus]|uniref:Negative cofactor 2 complex subunit beta n=1 Tax=Kluyveromyces marxianus TaxID=4911 RepID=A0ABX6ESC1_KLUMA|nr:negative cofactor 2 transcription regulator complex subunit ncb2 [Kluyveromyces marxianus]KAG0685510.1 negative cofactor 2 transcription regulator complex subunit ncb2 [Kluyveromyces marxianus]QGN13927.1 negative cofactor 2 complex subunit beta [Kluyveromyces marxianus]